MAKGTQGIFAFAVVVPKVNEIVSVPHFWFVDRLLMEIMKNKEFHIVLILMYQHSKTFQLWIVRESYPKMGLLTENRTTTGKQGEFENILLAMLLHIRALSSY